MFTYHGNDISVKVPKILDANRFLDFVKGFYAASSYEQAVRLAQQVSDNKNLEHSIISVNNFD